YGTSGRLSRGWPAHPGQPCIWDTSHFASGTKYVELAEVPGSKTRTFRACLGPTLMTPTLSYLAGVPGEETLFIQVTLSCAAPAPPARASASVTARAILHSAVVVFTATSFKTRVRIDREG